MAPQREESAPGRPAGVLWFALGVALSTATQLRPGGVPLGVGELLLVSWAGGMLVLALWRGRFEVPAPLRPFAVFWFFAYLLLGLGWTQASFRGLASQYAVYDAFAYFFMGFITAAVIARPRAFDGLSAAGGIVLAGTVLPMTAFLMLVLSGNFKLGPLTLWSGRFMAWCVNPNQVSLALAPVPFLLMYKLGTARTRGRRLAYGGLLACTVLVGAATLSDALNLAWAAALGIVLLLSWLRTVARPTLPYWKGGLVYILIPLLLGGAAVGIGYPLYVSVMEAAESVYGAGNQGSLRMALWKNGLLAMTESPLVGNGPGAFSGIYDPFTGGEAHNSFIDWSASTGLLGITAYLLLVGGIMVRAWRSGHSTLLAAIVALMLFSAFHFVLRQPLFWFYLMFVAVESHRAWAARAAPRPWLPLRAAPAGA